MKFMSDVMPDTMYAAASSTILDIVSKHRGGLLTFGFLLAIYLSTNGMVSLMRAFNACYRTVEKRNWFKTRLTATALTLMLSVVLILAVALLIAGQIGLNYVTQHLDQLNLHLDQYIIYVFVAIRFIIVFIVFFIAISCIYYFAPAVHYDWRFFSIGSVIATLAILALSYGFSYYITNFGSYNKVYGSIGVLIALMAWVQLVTIILLFGYEINASLHYARKMEAVNIFQRTQRAIKSFR